MKIFSREQSYTADQITLDRQGITSTDLMERAAESIFNWIHHRLGGEPVRFHVFCGIGNNGGDGLAVARYLTENGYPVAVYIVSYSDKRSGDFRVNLERLRERKIPVETLEESSNPPEIAPGDYILDAIFGIGLSRPPARWIRDLIAHINAAEAFRIAVDVPSGLQLDAVPEFPDGVVNADFVLSIGSPKLVFFLPDTGEYVREFAVLDIGFDPGFMEEAETDYEWIGPREVRPMLHVRGRFSHKGTYGHACIAGGSYGKVGAVVLSARACLKTGAGLVTAWVPRCGYLPLQVRLPEIMVETCAGENLLDAFPQPDSDRQFGAGMGMGTDPVTRAAFLEWISGLEHPIAIDADGLNILSENPEYLKALPARSVLTPHPGELRRLIGDWKDDFEKLEKARAFTREFDCILLIKGAYTLILGEGRGYVNSSGNPGMATAGSGDVLCGMITSLLAQGYPPLRAAIVGVFLHGRAGDLAAAESGMESLTAEGIIDGIGMAFKELKAPDDIDGAQ